MKEESDMTPLKMVAWGCGELREDGDVNRVVNWYQ